MSIVISRIMPAVYSTLMGALSKAKHAALLLELDRARSDSSRVSRALTPSRSLGSISCDVSGGDKSSARPTSGLLSLVGGQFVSSAVSKVSGVWLSRITPESKSGSINADIAKKREESSLRHSARFAAGSVVYSSNKDVSLLPVGEAANVDGQNDRPPVFGVVVEGSNLSPVLWLVDFYNGRSMYCPDDMLHFLDDLDADHKYRSDYSVQVDVWNKIKSLDDNDEEFIKEILFPKIVQAEGHEELSYSSIVNRFKADHPWLNETLLSVYVQLYRKKISSNIEDPNIPFRAERKFNFYVGDNRRDTGAERKNAVLGNATTLKNDGESCTKDCSDNAIEAFFC